MSNGSDPPGYDIFVSYAHVNDELRPYVERGWVSTFVATMKRDLAEELGRREAVRLWMDYELRGNHAVSPEIHRALAASRVLVLFLSTAYLESKWCLEELETFAARTKGLGGCIFPVVISPVEQAPTALRDLDLVTYRFWRPDEHGQPRTLADPQPDPARERDYYRLHRDLARDLARTLKALAPATGPDARPETAGTPADAQPPATAIRHSGRMPESSAMDGNLQPNRGPQTDLEPAARRPAPTPATIFLNGALDDLDLVRRTAGLLRERGLSCQLPLTAIAGFDPLTSPAEIRRDLEDTLADSDAVLFMYRDGPATQVRQNIKEVRKLAAANPRVPRRIDLCQPHPTLDALGIYDPDLHVIGTPGTCGEDCARACSEQFAARLAARLIGNGPGNGAGTGGNP